MGTPSLSLLGICLALSLCTTKTSAQDIGWAETKKTVITDATSTNAAATFWLTNQNSAPITISRIKPSCACTSVRAPKLPSHIPAGRTGMIRLDTEIKGKRGFLYKSAQVFTSAGTQKLEFNIAINPSSDTNRKQNQAIAKTDRQAVFRGRCATCHAAPAQGQSGAELYGAACGICHAAEHRASMVPDLRSHPLPDATQLTTLIKHGKPNSLMPAFHEQEGGPLNSEQIKSLVDHLLNRPDRTSPR